MAASSATLQAEIGRRRARLLAGDKAPVAASEIQKLVKTTAQESGIEVRSERILAVSGPRGLRGGADRGDACRARSVD